MLTINALKEIMCYIQSCALCNEIATVITMIDYIAIDEQIPTTEILTEILQTSLYEVQCKNVKVGARVMM